MHKVDHAQALHSGFGVRHWSVASALAALFLAFHLPFLPASLEDLDSINFALGLRHFDVARHQPHPPGYPLYIAVGKIAHRAIPSEAKALSLIGVGSGALAVFALVALFRAIDADGQRARTRSMAAALVATTAPLYWVTAGRPLSDVPGLAAALAIQALTLSAASSAGLIAASGLSAFATGIRSQVAWLTVPLLVLAIARRPKIERGRVAARSLAALVAGGLAWGVPLVVLTGGPAAYWQALFNQGAEDLSGIRMLWTTPTPRELVLALYYAFVAPWALPAVAAAVLVLALVGAVRLSRVARPTLATILVAFGPYFVFDLLFQETVTTRYALPLVVPLAYLAVRGASLLGTAPASVLIGGLAAFNAHIGGSSLAAYARQEAPVFRMLDDMRTSAALPGNPPLGAVLVMHRREEFDLRRPIAWLGDRMPPFERHLPAPPKHEWLSLVKYWIDGGRNQVWFVADPLRSDLALVDHSDRAGSYRWPLEYPVLIGGLRPNEMDWYRINPPGWFLGEGWALTPETAGVAGEDRRGPGRAPIQGWIRRRPGAVTLVVGGRHLAPLAPAHVTIALDGRTIDELTIASGFFLRMLHLDAGALAGQGDYAALAVSAETAGAVRLQPDPVQVAIEQFDAQSDDRVVFGYGDGWQEQEYNPTTGGLWRWTSERATLRVHAGGHPLTLTLAGEPPSVNFSKPSHVKISAGGRLIAEQTLSSTFLVQTSVPAEFVAGTENIITIETDQIFVPADRRRRSRDRRHLGLRVFFCELKPAS